MARGDAAKRVGDLLGAIPDPAGDQEIPATKEAVEEEAQKLLASAKANGCDCEDPEVIAVMPRPGEMTLLLSHDPTCPMIAMLTVDDSKPV